MRKKWFSLLIFAAAVTVFAGCGGSQGSGGGQADPAKKLEEQYASRMEAYQEYYETLKSEKSGYGITGTFTVDEEGLPLMWLNVANRDGKSSTGQLIGTEGGKARMLAEHKGWIYPYRGRGIGCMLAVKSAGAEEAVLVYDADKQDFVRAFTFDDGNYQEQVTESLVSGREPEAGYARSTLVASRPLVAYHKSGRQIAYLGVMDYKEFTRDTGIGTFYEDGNIGCDDSLRSYSLKDGSEYSVADIMMKFGGIGDFGWGCDFGFTQGEVVPGNAYAVGVEADNFGMADDEDDFERLVAELSKKPAFTQGEMLANIYSILLGYAVVDFDFNGYGISKLSDDKKAAAVENFIRNDVRKFYFTDGLRDENNPLWETDGVKAIKNWNTWEPGSRSCKDNIVTIGNQKTREEFQFQIAFNDAGDQISGITYIDPYANLPEWKNAYLNQLDLTRLAGISFVNVNGDDVPEIFAVLGAGESKVLYYLDKSYTIHDIWFSGGFCSYNEEQIYLDAGHSGVRFHEVLTRNAETGIYERVFACNVLLNQSPSTYYIDDTQVGKEEYDAKLEEVTAGLANMKKWDGRVEGYGMDKSIYKEWILKY